MNESQTVANEIRDTLAEHELLKRMGIEVLWSTATDHSLTLRARHRNRVITIERAGAGWDSHGPDGLAAALVQELLAEALATRRPAAAPPVWRRVTTDPAAGV